MKSDVSLIERIKQMIETKTSFRVSMHYLTIKVRNPRIAIYLLPSFDILELVKFKIRLSENSIIEYEFSEPQHHSWRLIVNGDLIVGTLWHGDSLKFTDTQLFDTLLDLEAGGIPSPLASYILPVLQ